MLRGVIFDFHNTLVRADSLSAWVTEAAHTIGDPQPSGGEIIPVLRSVWSRAAIRDPDLSWDLDPVLHRHPFEKSSPRSPRAVKYWPRRSTLLEVLDASRLLRRDVLPDH